MLSFIDYFSTLTEEEEVYRQSWLKNGTVSDYIRLPTLSEQSEGNGRVILSASPYLEDERQDIHICKHPCFMPPYLHSHEFTEITYAARGEAAENVEGTAFTLKEGDMLILNPGSYHTISVFDEHAVIINMIIRKNIFVRIAEQTGSRFEESSYLVYRSIGSEAESYIGRIFEEQIKERPFCGSMQDIWLSALIIALMRKGRPDMEKDRGKDKKSIYAILEYIRGNLKEVTLTSLAGHIGLTPQYTSELIKYQAGTNFSALVRNQKLEKSLELLRRTDKSSKEIALELGFSPEHFSRIFRENFSATPETMRRQLQSR